MVVGIAEFELRIPEATSLKAKRGVVKKVIDRTRSRFNVTMAEVGKQDVHGRAVIGFAVVGSDSRYVNGALDKILDYVTELSVAEVISEKLEIITM